MAQLFVQRLLPERPLKPWARQRRAAAATPAALLVAHFEDGLKEAYGALIAVVTAGMGDTLTHVKQAMIKTAHAMLDAKPEGERLLLPALVNKLGDPERKVASRLTHLLGLLVRSHPAMKPLVVAEVQKFVLRPNAPERAQYYACVFLNQLVLTRREAPTAHRLLLVEPPHPLGDEQLVHLALALERQPGRRDHLLDRLHGRRVARDVGLEHRVRGLLLAAAESQEWQIGALRNFVHAETSRRLECARA